MRRFTEERLRKLESSCVASSARRTRPARGAHGTPRTSEASRSWGSSTRRSRWVTCRGCRRLGRRAVGLSGTHLCRCGLRPPLAVSRLQRLADGRGSCSCARRAASDPPDWKAAFREIRGLFGGEDRVVEGMLGKGARQRLRASCRWMSPLAGSAAAPNRQGLAGLPRVNAQCAATSAYGRGLELAASTRRANLQAHEARPLRQPVIRQA
jgi:hypothetical protein